jgi:hypothetical protein
MSLFVLLNKFLLVGLFLFTLFNQHCRPSDSSLSEYTGIACIRETREKYRLSRICTSHLRGWRVRRVYIQIIHEETMVCIVYSVTLTHQQIPSHPNSPTRPPPHILLLITHSAIHGNFLRRLASHRSLSIVIPFLYGYHSRLLPRVCIESQSCQPLHRPHLTQFYVYF